jgi:hypothetical protein
MEWEILVVGGGTLLAFIGTVYKMFYKPIHELIVQMTIMNTNFENMTRNDDIRDNRLNRHSEKIDEHDKRITKLEYKKEYTNDSGR